MAGGTNKMRDISTLLQMDFNEAISNWYKNELLSSIQIAERILELTKISITPRTVQRQIKALGLPRSRGEASALAVKNGRRSYEKLRKKIKSSDLRTGISLKKRYVVFKRDHFRCVLCGVSAENGTVLVVDHITPVVKGGDNSLGNLRVLCRACNHGKMLAEERHE